MGALIAPVGDDTNPPSILAQPASATVVVGQPAVFNVTVSTGSAATYQWRRNGNVISGANFASYSINSVTAADDGAIFACSITNPNGTVTSSNAVLTVVQGGAVENLIQNFNFSDGLDPWFFYTNQVGTTYTTNANAFNLSIGGTGTNIQLSQPGISITQNTEYLLSFSAKCLSLIHISEPTRPY